MASVPAASKPKLTKLFLFNSSWGPREGEEHKKIVFYWPPETETNDQVKSVGLIEAVIRFGQTFSSQPAHSLQTQKTRSVWRQVEQDYYLCFTVSVPSVKKQNKDGADVVEYRPDDLSDNILLGILDRAHDMFSLFNGGLKHVLESSDSNKDVLRERVQHFYTRYLATLKLEQSSVMDMWGGIQYLPLETEPFLRVQTLINRAMIEFPQVESCLFLHQGQLVWSEIKPEVTKLLVHYMTTTLLPSIASLAPPSPTSSHQGRYLVGGADTDTLPLVHLDTDSARHLVVYHAVHSTLCLLLPSPPSHDWYGQYSDRMGPLVSDLSADLSHLLVSASTPSTSDNNVRFLYYNGANFAVKSTLEPGHDPGVVTLAAELAADLSSDMLGGELTGKLGNDQWLVVRVAGVRTIIIILTMKNLNLLEVSEEVAKLDKSSFSKICLL